MTSYGVRILDGASGRFVFSAPCVGSPFRAGQVVAGARAVLVGRDGYRADDLELRGYVYDRGATRPMDPREEAAMNSAFEHYGAIAEPSSLRANRAGAAARAAAVEGARR